MEDRAKRIVYGYDGLTQIVCAIGICAATWLERDPFGGLPLQMLLSTICVFVVFRWFRRIRSEFIMDDGKFFVISTDAGRSRYSKEEIYSIRMDWRRWKLQVLLKSGRQEEHRVPVILMKKAIYQVFPEFD